MYIALHERPQPPTTNLAQPVKPLQADILAALYRELLTAAPEGRALSRAHDFLCEQITKIDAAACDLPASPHDLESWMLDSTRQTTQQYARYLEERKTGAPRRFFANRAHALYFLRAVAPTKLVDGAWLYGLIAHWRNPRFADLIRTFVEELGDGAADKNHVLLYRQLLTRYGLDPVEGLDDSFYTQGLIQLALSRDAENFLPEVIGFNLGYEQLPLHLLITAYELNELGIDPYYFTLHVTVDNADTGHARCAVQAVHDNLPRFGDADDFWQRVRVGYQLGNAGKGSGEVIAGFEIESEVVRIFAHKSAAGHGAHSDYCRVAGRSVNDWLAQPGDLPAFLAALQQAGWIKLGQPVSQSRFWALLQGPRAEMFGVFTSYELQVIHDWIRGESSADGQAFAQDESTDGQSPARRPSFRVAARMAAARGQGALESVADGNLLDSDLQALRTQLARLDDQQQADLLVQAMAPAHHWTPAGLLATRLFCARVL